LADAVAAAAAAGVRAAATGERTANTLRELGFTDVRVPQNASARGLVDDLAGVVPGRALFPRGNLALRTLPDGLVALGWEVDEGMVYETSIVSQRPASAELIEKGLISAIVVRSPSAVRALVAHVQIPASVPLICAGRTTAEAAIEADLVVAAVADSPSSQDVARAVSEFFDLASDT
jgi:uroporphyrinogen-III synthase